MSWTFCEILPNQRVEAECIETRKTSKTLLGQGGYGTVWEFDSVRPSVLKSQPLFPISLRKDEKDRELRPEEKIALQRKRKYNLGIALTLIREVTIHLHLQARSRVCLPVRQVYITRHQMHAVIDKAEYGSMNRFFTYRFFRNGPVELDDEQQQPLNKYERRRPISPPPPNCPNGPYTVEQMNEDTKILRYFARQILILVTQLHELGIAHADLKPDNILIATTSANNLNIKGNSNKNTTTNTTNKNNNNNNISSSSSSNNNNNSSSSSSSKVPYLPPDNVSYRQIEVFLNDFGVSLETAESYERRPTFNSDASKITLSQRFPTYASCMFMERGTDSFRAVETFGLPETFKMNERRNQIKRSQAILMPWEYTHCSYEALDYWSIACILAASLFTPRKRITNTSKKYTMTTLVHVLRNWDFPVIVSSDTKRVNEEFYVALALSLNTDKQWEKDKGLYAMVEINQLSKEEQLQNVTNNLLRLLPQSNTSLLPLFREQPVLLNQWIHLIAHGLLMNPMYRTSPKELLFMFRDLLDPEVPVQQLRFMSTPLQLSLLSPLSSIPMEDPHAMRRAGNRRNCTNSCAEICSRQRNQDQEDPLFPLQQRNEQQLQLQLQYQNQEQQQQELQYQHQELQYQHQEQQQDLQYQHQEQQQDLQQRHEISHQEFQSMLSSPIYSSTVAPSNQRKRSRKQSTTTTTASLSSITLVQPEQWDQIPIFIEYLEGFYTQWTRNPVEFMQIRLRDAFINILSVGSYRAYTAHNILLAIMLLDIFVYFTPDDNWTSSIHWMLSAVAAISITLKSSELDFKEQDISSQLVKLTKQMVESIFQIEHKMVQTFFQLLFVADKTQFPWKQAVKNRKSDQTPGQVLSRWIIYAMSMPMFAFFHEPTTLNNSTTFLLNEMECEWEHLVDDNGLMNREQCATFISYLYNNKKFLPHIFTPFVQHIFIPKSSSDP